MQLCVGDDSDGCFTCNPGTPSRCFMCKTGFGMPNEGRCLSNLPANNDAIDLPASVAAYERSKTAFLSGLQSL